jgi:hypothetical protein
MKRLLFAVVLCGAALACTAAPADVVFSQGGRFATAAETGAAVDPVPVGSFVHQFSVTTTTDIIQFDELIFAFDTMALYQFDAIVDVDTEAPSSGLVAAFPSAGADSYLTTPGLTGVAGNPSEPFTNGNGFFDSSNDGPQSNFRFAQLTLPGLASGTFSGLIRVRSDDGLSVVTEPFSFTITAVPEASAFVLLGAIVLPVSAVLYAKRRGRRGTNV